MTRRNMESLGLVMSYVRKDYTNDISNPFLQLRVPLAGVQVKNKAFVDYAIAVIVQEQERRLVSELRKLFLKSPRRFFQKYLNIKNASARKRTSGSGSTRRLVTPAASTKSTAGTGNAIVGATGIRRRK